MSLCSRIIGPVLGLNKPHLNLLNAASEYKKAILPLRLADPNDFSSQHQIFQQSLTCSLIRLYGQIPALHTSQSRPFAKMPDFQLQHRCHECRKCTQPYRTPRTHVDFKVDSNSPTDGIDFEDCEYTAQSITNAFIRFIPGHMDWPIKKQALDRWNALAFDLFSGPVEFDLLPVFRILDDFLFLRALQDNWSMEWVDKRKTGPYADAVGWATVRYKMRGANNRISVVRPSTTSHQTVQDVLDTILHEMCHAILQCSCNCMVCTCHVIAMSEKGLTGHGPSWQILIRVADEIATLYLKGFSVPYWANARKYQAKASQEQEEKTKTKILGSMFEKVKGEGTAAAQAKKAERAKVRASREDNTPESDERKHEEYEA